MEIYATVLGLGLLSAAVMAVFFYLARRYLSSDTRDFWVFGQLLFQNMKRARVAGLLAHLAFGSVIAFVYMLFWSAFDVQNLWLFPLIGLATGALHGLLVAVTQLMIFDDNKNELQATLTHTVSHALYGLVLGIGVGIADANIELTDRYAANIDRMTIAQTEQ